MYRTNESLDHEIMRDDRLFSLLVYDDQGRQAGSESGDIISMQHSITATDPSMIIGDVVTQTVNIEFSMDEEYRFDYFNFKRGAKIRIYYMYPRATGGYIPAGVFKIIDSTRKGSRLRVTAKDMLYGIDRAYVSKLTYPASIKDVLSEIAQQIGIPFKSPVDVLETMKYEGDDSDYEFTTDSDDSYIMIRDEGEYIIPAKLEGYTLQQALSKCAEVYGLSAYQDRQGILDFYAPIDNFGDLSWTSEGEYDSTTYVITPERADEPEHSKQKVEVRRIRIVENGEEVVHAETSSPEKDAIPYELTIEDPIPFDCPNPLDDYENILLDKLIELYLGKLYTPATVYYRMGDPRLDVYDPVYCFDTSTPTTDILGIYISSLDYSYDGGLSCTVNSSIGETVGNISRDEQPATRGAKQSAGTASPPGGGPISQKLAAMQKKINELADEIENIKKLIKPTKEER